ncbi:hypothetical protein KI811_03525 [Geobacter hydrogenophilus]|nr:hypothetical protein [Geobacter hydrogenophilus]MBT1076319.1 hypothetical protein [Geobacter grbiciae]
MWAPFFSFLARSNSQNRLSGRNPTWQRQNSREQNRTST